MSDNTRSPGGRDRGRGDTETDAILALSDTIEDLESILETLEAHNISTIEELVAFIGDLETELEHLKSAAGQ